MAKKKRRNSQMTIPLAPIAGLIPMVAPAINLALNGQSMEVVVDNLVYNTIGYSMGSGIMDLNKLGKNITPLIIGLLVHKFVGGAPLNLNRILARAKVPFVRI